MGTLMVMVEEGDSVDEVKAAALHSLQGLTPEAKNAILQDKVRDFLTKQRCIC